MKSDELKAQIQDLHDQLGEALTSEAQERCREIFGRVPKDYGVGTEELFGNVARVYCVRAYKEKRIDLPDHEWIARWHKHEPKASVEELLETAQEYFDEGCGFAG